LFVGFPIQFLKHKNQRRLYQVLQKLKEGLLLSLSLCKKQLNHVCNARQFSSLIIEFFPCKFSMTKFLYSFLSLIKCLFTELMLLGFISLLLTVFQGLISRICVHSQVTSFMLPCKRDTISSNGSEHYSHLTTNNRRRLLSEEANSGQCLHEVYYNVFNHRHTLFFIFSRCL
jgi:hypothetical protein